MFCAIRASERPVSVDSESNTAIGCDAVSRTTNPKCMYNPHCGRARLGEIKLRIPEHQQISHKHIVRAIDQRLLSQLALEKPRAQTKLTQSTAASLDREGDACSSQEAALGPTLVQLLEKFIRSFAQPSAVSHEQASDAENRSLAQSVRARFDVNIVDSFGWRLAKYAPRNTAVEYFADTKRLKGVINSLDSMHTLLQRRTPTERANILAGFPPTDTQELQCLNGTRLRINAINAALQTYESKVAGAASLISPNLSDQLVPSAVQKQLNKDQIDKKLNQRYHIHMPMTAYALLGANPKTLTQVDDYYMTASHGFSAANSYNLITQVPILLRDEINTALDTDGSRSVIQELVELLEWCKDQMEGTEPAQNQPLNQAQIRHNTPAQGLHNNALAQMIMSAQLHSTIEQDSFPYQDYMSLNEDKVIIDYNQLQQDLEQICIARFETQPVEYTAQEFGVNAQGALMEFKEIFNDSALLETLAKQPEEFTALELNRILDFLGALSDPKVSNTSLQSCHLLLGSLSSQAKNIQCPFERFGALFKENPALRSKMERICARLSGTTPKSNAHSIAVILDDCFKPQSQPLHLSDWKLLFSNAVPTAFLIPLKAQLIHKNNISSLVAFFNTATSLKDASKRCYTDCVHFLATTTDNIQQKVIRAVSKFPITCNLLARIAFQENLANVLENIVKSRQSVRVLSFQTMLFPVFAEQLISRGAVARDSAVVRILDSTQWQDRKLKLRNTESRLHLHNPLSIAISMQNKDRVRDLLRARPELMDRHIPQYSSGRNSDRVSMLELGFRCAHTPQGLDTLTTLGQELTRIKKDHPQLLKQHQQNTFAFIELYLNVPDHPPYELIHSMVQGDFYGLDPTQLNDDEKTKVRIAQPGSRLNPMNWTSKARIKTQLYKHCAHIIRIQNSEENAPSALEKNRFGWAKRCLESLSQQGYGTLKLNPRGLHSWASF